MLQGLVGYDVGIALARDKTEIKPSNSFCSDLTIGREAENQKFGLKQQERGNGF